MSKVGVVTVLVLSFCLVAWGYVHGCRDTEADYAVQLAEEKDAHAKTKKALEAALATGVGWQAAYEEMESSAAAYRDTAEACLVREKDWRNAVERHESVLREASLHPRSAEERDHVVDAATRRKAAAALNAPW